MTQHLPRTVTVNVLTTRNLEIPEPDWCAGHREDRTQFKPDITHFGPERHIEINGFRLFTAVLAQSPYSELSTTEPRLHIAEGDLTGSYTPDEVEELAAALEASAERLRALGRQLAELLAGGGDR